ncbi:c-type cytochrome [Sphingomonas sp. AP4-R1]|uniref:c-type cytochrome n=1 Tax=Sphingomonas sp. AP4-R1 TaxID=2735134 RepID=UPI00149384A8|nr:c-type cytochrome [Sphingomonas sp. AP4-R1]QJU58532.1 c-type cytochrome [Sphingomonas sp. AP4-R1]
MIVPPPRSRSSLRSASALLIAGCILAGCSRDDREARRQAAGPHPSLEALARVADAQAGSVAFRRCAACHPIAPGTPDLGGPNLFGIMGAPIGHHSDRFGYTAALQAVGGVWTPARMDAWMADPHAMVPRTTMNFDGVADPLIRADIIAYLQTRK